MAIRNIEKPETALQEKYWKFWEGFNAYTQSEPAFCSEFKVHPYPSVRSYQDYSIGEPYHLVVGVNFKKHEIRVGVYFRDLDAYLFYCEMLKNGIERKIGRCLKWSRHETKASAYLYDSADFDANHGFENAFEVMANRMLQIKSAFNFVPPKLSNDI